MIVGLAGHFTPAVSRDSALCKVVGFVTGSGYWLTHEGIAYGLWALEQDASGSGEPDSFSQLSAFKKMQKFPPLFFRSIRRLVASSSRGIVSIFSGLLEAGFGW